MNIMNVLIEKAKSEPKRIIFPEATEPKILQAAKKAFDMGMVIPILVGNLNEIQETALRENINISDMNIVSTNDEKLINSCVKEYLNNECIFSEKKLTRMATNPLNFAAMLVNKGEADGMVAGLTYTTADVILAGQCLIGLKEGISTPSSLFLMNVPDFNGSEGNLIVISDGGVCEEPSVRELADISITTADTVTALLSWEPRVALLSYSTKGSVKGEKTNFILKVLNEIKDRRPELKVDGELQLDSAIIPEVAAKKSPDNMEVAGQANILIVPDLNVGNILYKSIQRFAKAEAYGPFLQGFKKTISDLSRGSSVEDIFGVIAMVVVHAQELCKNKME